VRCVFTAIWHPDPLFTAFLLPFGIPIRSSQRFAMPFGIPIRSSQRFAMPFGIPIRSSQRFCCHLASQRAGYIG
jgi:hypothetical protein